MLKVKFLIDVSSETAASTIFFNSRLEFKVGYEDKGDRRLTSFTVQTDLPTLLNLSHSLGWGKITLSTDRIKIIENVTDTDKDS